MIVQLISCEVSSICDDGLLYIQQGNPLFQILRLLPMSKWENEYMSRCWMLVLKLILQLMLVIIMSRWADKQIMVIFYLCVCWGFRPYQMIFIKKRVFLPDTWGGWTCAVSLHPAWCLPFCFTNFFHSFARRNWRFSLLRGLAHLKRRLRAGWFLTAWRALSLLHHPHLTHRCKRRLAPLAFTTPPLHWGSGHGWKLKW